MAVRGVFFTISSVLLVALMVTAITASYRYSVISIKVPVIRARVMQSNNYVFNLQHNLLERALTDVGYRATLSLIEYMDKTGNFSKQIYDDYREVMLNGTVGGVDLAHMQGHTLPEHLDAISNLSNSSLHIITEFTLNDVRVYQDETTTPMEIGFELDISFFVDATISNWTATRSIITKISIEGLDDPYYNLNSDGRFVPKFKPADIRAVNISANQTWNFAMFKKHLDDVTYAWEPQAPNFLTRMENRTENSTCCGIEAMINPNKLEFDTDLIYKSMSYVDYCFFGEDCPGSEEGMRTLWDIKAIRNDDKYYKFRLEQYHIVKYNLTGEDYMGDVVCREPPVNGDPSCGP